MKGMKREYTFAQRKAAPVRPPGGGSGGLKATKKQEVKGMTTKPGHRVPKAKRPPPFAKPKPRGL
jgi:hypothetical protein